MSSEQPDIYSGQDLLSLQRATFAAQEREWESWATLTAWPSAGYERTGFLNAYGARQFYAFFMTTPVMRDLRRRECELGWYIGVEHPDGSSVWSTVDAPYIQQTVFFKTPAGVIMPVDNPTVVPAGEPLLFQCPVHQLHRMMITLSAGSKGYGDALASAHRCSVLDYMGAKKSEHLWVEGSEVLAVRGRVVSYHIAGLAPAPISVDLYTRVLHVIGQHFTADPERGEQQPRTRENKSRLRRALREAFPSEVMHFSFAPRIYRRIEGGARSLDREITANFLELFQ